MTGIGHRCPLGAFHVARPELHESWWCDEIGIPRDDQRSRGDGGQLGVGVGRSQRLGWRVGLSRVFLDLEPALRPIWIGAPIGRAHLAEVRGERSDAGNLDPRDHVLNLFVAHGAGAGSDDEAGQPFGMRGRVVERDESSPGDADEMESPEREVVGECMKIVGGMTRLRSARRVRQAPPPSSTIERDHAIAGLRECRRSAVPSSRSFR